MSDQAAALRVLKEQHLYIFAISGRYANVQPLDPIEHADMLCAV
jgi:hypothetical protein